jgi:hypothetical protein
MDVFWKVEKVVTIGRPAKDDVSPDSDDFEPLMLSCTLDNFTQDT